MVNSLFTVVSERTVSTTKQYNVTESFLRQSFYPYCQFTKTPILRLRGLCKPSNINTYYTLKYVNGSIVYKGVTDSPIEFLLSGSFKWTITVNGRANYGLYFDRWEVVYYWKEHMEHCQRLLWTRKRRAVLAGPEDVRLFWRSVHIQQWLLPEDVGEVRPGAGLRHWQRRGRLQHPAAAAELQEDSSSPQAGVGGQDLGEEDSTAMPVDVRVTLTLLDISAIREAENEIDIKFTAKFEWKESRAKFYNLKEKISHKNLDQSESTQLWIPNLIYRINKDNDDTRSELKNSKFQIKRQGNFTRSNLDSADEIEIFTVMTIQYSCFNPTLKSSNANTTSECSHLIHR